MEKTKQDLKNFYNKNANSFSNSRKKFWPEFEFAKKEITDIVKKKGEIKIIELWCWDGRFYKYLRENFLKEQIKYVWMDLSENLIDIAKKENPDAKFEVNDMLDFLENKNQQNYDLVLAVASFQHIKKYTERLIILKNIYRLLDYNGKLIMFNWSFSKWFLKKFKIHILKSIFLSILTLGKKKINDINIPWKWEKKTYFRYYHIFFLSELRKLLNCSGFLIKELKFIANNWKKNCFWSSSRNSILIWEKTVFKN